MASISILTVDVIRIDPWNSPTPLCCSLTVECGARNDDTSAVAGSVISIVPLFVVVLPIVIEP